MIFKFSYPDIPYMVDRSLYDYLFNIDRVIRAQGDAINQLAKKVNNG